MVIGQPVAALDEQQRPEEVVVDEDDFQRAEGGQRRPAQRHDDAEYCRQTPAPSTSAASVSSSGSAFM